MLLSTKNVVRPTLKSSSKVEIPETVTPSSMLIVPPAESIIKLSEAVSISLSPVSPT